MSEFVTDALVLLGLGLVVAAGFLVWLPLGIFLLGLLVLLLATAASR